MQAAFGQPPAAPVTVTETRQTEIFNEVQLIGSVTSAQNALLSTEISGLVKQVYVDEGSFVAIGDPLLALDSDLAQLTLDRENAAKRQAEKSLKDAKRRLAEAKSLIKNRSISESALKDIEAEVQIDEANLSQAIAQSNFQQALTDRHTLKAPFAGVISKKMIDPGEWVNTGSATFELVDTTNLRLDFYVAEDFIASINNQPELSYTLKAYPNRPMTGKITSIVPVADQKARTFLLRVAINTNDLPGDIKMVSGMSVSAKLLVPTGRQGIVVPRDAILRKQDGRITVWTTNKSEGETIVQENRVKTGLGFGNNIEILSGLPLNAQVVVKGNEALRAGQRVIVSSK